MIINAQDHESLDALIWRRFGRSTPLVEQVLAVNRGLGAIAHALPMDHAVTVPDELVRPVSAPVKQTINIWD